MLRTSHQNEAADRYVEILKEHHADAPSSDNTGELIEYALMDAMAALFRGGIASKVEINITYVDNDAPVSVAHSIVDIVPGIYDDEPEPLDAETIAGREAAQEQTLRQAGRGQ